MTTININPHEYFLYIYDDKINEEDRIKMFNLYSTQNAKYYKDLYLKLLPTNARTFANRPIKPMVLDLTNI